MLQNNDDNKIKWENFYSILDPYGQDKWYSDIMRRKSTIELLTKRELTFDSCLELGCGEGRITKKMLEFCKKITAVELSSKAIKKAKIINEQDLEQITFIEDDMYQVTFEKEAFDLINAIESLDYTNKKKDEIDKWIQWLKPEGYIIFSGPNLPGYFTYNEILDLFSRKDLTIVEIKIVTTKFPLQWLISRVRLFQNDFFWSINMFSTKIFPRLFAKHIAVLAKKEK